MSDIRGPRPESIWEIPAEELGSEGWLWPALFKYFKRASKMIHARPEAK